MTDVSKTTTKGLALQTVGGNDDQWGGILNDTIKLIDTALGGTLDRVITGDVMLTSVEVENTGYHFRGTLTDTATIIFPSYFGLAVIRNSADRPVSCGIAGGKFVSISIHGCSAVWSDGTDFTDINQFLTISGELSGVDATSHSGEDGGSLDIAGGAGDGPGMGGPVSLTGGSSGTDQGVGGAVYLSGGLGSFVGGDIHLEGGQARSTGGDGGDIWITAGTAFGIGHQSGDVNITAYKAQDSALPGNVRLTMGSGGLYVTGLPTTDPAISGRVWLDHGVMILSGSKLTNAVSGSFLSTSGGSITGSLQIGTTTNAGYKLDVVGGATRLAGTVLTAPSIVQATGATIPTTAFPSGTLLDLVGPPASSVGLTLDAFASGASGGVAIVTGRSAPATGGTLATQGLLSLRGMGWDGTNYSSSSRATILFQAAENFSPTAQGTVLAFMTTKKASLTLAEAMRIQDTGNVTIGATTDAGYKLDVNATTGGVRFSLTGVTAPLLLSGTTGTLPAVAPNSMLQVVGADATDVRLSTDTFAAKGVLSFRRAEGTSTAPTALVNQSLIGSVQGLGYATTGYASFSRAAMTFYAGANWTDTSQPTQIRIATTPVGATVMPDVLTIHPTGNVAIGTNIQADSGYKLDVTGSARASTMTLPIATKTGTAYTVAATDSTVILNPSGAFTLTLPAATTNGGRMLWLNLIAAFAVTSATANVIPLAGGAATTALMSASAGKYCMLQSDATNWQIIMAN